MAEQPYTTDVFYEYDAPAGWNGVRLSVGPKSFVVDDGRVRVRAEDRAMFEGCGFYREFRPIKSQQSQADEELERVLAVHREKIEAAAQEMYRPDFQPPHLETPNKTKAKQAVRELEAAGEPVPDLGDGGA